MTKLIEHQLIKEINNYLEPLKKDYRDYDFNCLADSNVRSTDICQMGVTGPYKYECEPNIEVSFNLIRLYISDK